MNFLDNFCGFLREQLNVAEKSLNSFSVWFESQEEDIQNMLSLLGAMLLILLYRSLF